MAWATLNTTTIYKGSLFMPLYGMWCLDAVLSLANTITNPCTIVIGNMTLVGAVYRTQAFAGATFARLFAGQGGWAKTIEPRAYNSQPVTLSNVLSTTASEVGEAVNVQQDGGIGNFYVRPQGLASNVLRNLCPLWWIDNTGVTQVAATRTSKAITSDFVCEDFDPGKGVSRIATEDMASWVPGNTFTGPTLPGTQTISGVRINMRDDGVARLEVLHA